MMGNKNRPVSIVDTAYVRAGEAQPLALEKVLILKPPHSFPLEETWQTPPLDARKQSTPRPSAKPPRTSRNQSGLCRGLDGRSSRMKRHRLPETICSMRSARSELLSQRSTPNLTAWPNESSLIKPPSSSPDLYLLRIVTVEPTATTLLVIL